MARIDLDHIAHAYRPNPQGPKDFALKEVNLTWDDGGAYALLGPSGCGKTTLLNVISGLLIPRGDGSCSAARTSRGCRPKRATSRRCSSSRSSTTP